MGQHLAKTPGALPPADSATVAGVSLPAGARPLPSSDFAMHPKRAVRTSPLWLSAKPTDAIEKLVSPLIAAFPSTGLWPLVLETLEGAPERPWLAGEIDPSGASDPAHHDVSTILGAWWSNVVPSEDEDPEALAALAPFGRTFPGLAKPSKSGPVGPIAAALAEREGSLGLTSVTRPADAVAAIGWLGPINCFSDMGMLAAVLRSWEDRFDAYVIGIGFDTLTLAVGRPVDEARARAVAAEHFAVCPDAIYQGEGSIEAHAETLVDAISWSFWWD
ncbi:MAG: DUF4253 domain-containing protein [Polyangiaceae bacterium]